LKIFQITDININMTSEIATIEDLGPAMAALTPKQRAYTTALLDNGGNQTAAALTMNPEMTVTSARTTGSQLARHPKIIAALKEEADKRVRVGAPLAIDVMLEIMQTPGHKDRFRAAVEVANRSGLLVIQQVEHIHDHRHTAPEMIAKIEAMARQLKLDPVQLLGSVGISTKSSRAVKAEPIDTEFTEVLPEREPEDPFSYSPPDHEKSHP
jgi:phage terminase small subunit